MGLKNINFFRWFSLDDTYEFNGHRHNTYEVNIILSGNMNVTVEESVFELSAGDMLFWSPNLFHCNRIGTDKHVEFLSIHFETKEDFLNKKETVFYHISKNKMPIINILISESEKNGYEDGSSVVPLLEALLIIARNNSKTPHFFNDSSATTYGKIIKLIDDNTVQTIPTIAEMARICGVCETTLKNSFKQHTGKSIKRYFNDLRLQYAKEMLLDGMNASQVSNQLGFSSISYFSQFFKKNTNMSVREFLSQYK